ncbi:ATP-binding protein [Saccharothrix deserti]|uniref:ATP-binding protein n=1 Tax=Saccharothrix deserti TaxID=2593674 RepID=UPI00131D6305|nr:LuxR C-terminal-related transcriptional regulator [Saccharothrix deserti]
MSTAVRQRTSGLSLELTSFVGRRREVGEVRRLLSTSRLVTLSGPGGVGKTRLAIEVTNAVRRVFPDGVVLVELDQLRDPVLVPNTVAVAVGLRENAGRATVEMLIDYLAPRQLLLVLDNSEHLIDPVAELVGALLRGCPELRILSTSRESMGIQGEVVMPVPPLTLPDPQLPFAEQDLVQSEAVSLFAERAATTRPGFTVNGNNGAVVAEICHRLDGLPLAIELAAARVRVLSEKDILARLSDQPHLLAGRGRGVPARQQTLRACIEWSYGLCSPQEQLLWARLSVFAGAFELDAAEDVCSGDGLTADDVLHTVASLMDKSILAGEQDGDVMRYRMLETIREFGVERLQHIGEYADLRHRHSDWYLQLVERARSEWISPRQVDWFTRLDREHANIQAALDHCVAEPGELESGMRILIALFHFYWWGRGWSREGRLWLARALDQPSPLSVVRANALLTDATLALGAGDMEGGRQRIEDAKAILDTVDDPAIEGFVCWAAGCAAEYSGDLPTSITIFERGLDVLPPGQHLTLRLDILVSYSIAAGLIGDTDRANTCHAEVLRISEPAGERFHRSYALWTLGLYVMQQGDHHRAAALHKQSLQLRRELQDVTGAGWSLESLAWAESAFGEPERVATLLGTADRLWEIMGRPLRAYQHLYPYHEECERSAQERLGDKRFQDAFERGRAMSVDEAIAFALDEQPPTPVEESPPAAPRVLTRRESEIAELIAEGLTNREVASRLVISVRTAESHAEHILTKLGFTSRVQIATWVAEQRARPSAG